MNIVDIIKNELIKDSVIKQALTGSSDKAIQLTKQNQNKVFHRKIIYLRRAGGLAGAAPPKTFKRSLASAAFCPVGAI